ncbi:MAG: MFS transporter [Chromatiales bacterium]|nr:MFS transporter [Chromatiales bacterium]
MQDQESPGVAWPRPAVAWWTLAILVVAFVFSFIHRIVIGLLVDPIKADLNLTDTQMGLLLGLAFAVFYALLGLPIGRWSDRYSRRTIIGVAILIWSVSTALCGLVRSYFELFAARVGTALGMAALSPAAYSMIADLFPRDRLGRALGIYQSGAFFGAGLAFLLGAVVIGFVARAGEVSLPLVGVLEPWRLVFIIVGLPGCLVALLMLTVREPERRGAGALAGESAGWAQWREWADGHQRGLWLLLLALVLLNVAVFVLAGLVGLLIALSIEFFALLALWSLRDSLPFASANRRLYITHFAGFSLLAVPISTLANWAPSWFIRVLGYTPAETGWLLGLLLLVLSPLGILAGGWLTDLLGRRGMRDAPMRIGIAVAILLVLPSLFGTTLTSPGPALVAFGLLVFCGSLTIAVAPAALQLVTPGRMRAQMSALWMLVLNIVTAAVGPTLVGLVTDRVFGDPLAVGQSMALVNVVCMPFAALLLWLGLRQFRAAAGRE